MVKRVETVGCLLILALTCAMPCAAAGPQPKPRLLTFDERVAAQRAIEEVYWYHRLWPKENPTPKPPLSAVVSDAAIRAKVEDCLKKSNALDTLWHRPITAKQLQAEMDRIVKNTHDPETLRRLFSSLANDPFVIAETLVRQSLSDRLVRDVYANDDRLHGDVRRAAEAALAACHDAMCMKSMGGEYRETTWQRRKEVTTRDDEADGGRVIPLDAGEWQDHLERLERSLGGSLVSLPTMKLSRLEETADAFVVTAVLSQGKDEVRTATSIWTKRPFNAWWAEQSAALDGTVRPADGPFSVVVPDGAACTNDTWMATSTGTNVPSARKGHSAVWTGSEMIVWGGDDGAGLALNTGGRYNPSTDTWIATSTTNAPSARGSASVWTGSEMIVWGGTSDTTGGRYNPSTDTWIATSTVNAPSARSGNTSIWTGSEMIVWGGASGATGGRYNPSTDTWTATSTLNAPSARNSHTAVWTGSEMIIWGGVGATFLNTGGRYDPFTDTWVATSTGTNVPAARDGHTAVWTGSQMIVWGGRDNAVPFNAFNTGGLYDPTADTWGTTSTGADVPSPVWGHSAAWTGTEMIVWAGRLGTGSTVNTGGRYNPTTDTWLPTSTGANDPSARWEHTVVWTGDQMIVWGGPTVHLPLLNTGGLYCACPGGRIYYRDADGDGYGSPGESIPSCDGSIPAGYVADHSDCNDTNSAIHPGAAEVCNGIDDNCNGLVDEDAQGVDGDGDGVHNACDCAPSDPSAWAVPQLISGLALSAGSPTTLTWVDQGPTIGPGVLYDVVTGDLIQLLSAGSFAGATCLVDQTPVASAAASGVPTAGQGFYYVVRARNVCAVGSYGASSLDTSSPCP